jgi:alpha-amylase
VRKATLILCIHNHQPVGNLPDIFEQAYRDAYLPFLEALERHPAIKFVLHNTGPLLEWYEEHAPDYLARVRALVARGQVEILTGGFYEPIMPAIPERDALGQIARMTSYAETVFGVRPRGMWLAERVWEPRLARTIAQAGVEYVPLDDYEFRLAGLADEDLCGSFVTEDEGVPLKLLPISKRLRYAIPFGEPEETVSFMRSLAGRGEGLMALFGDDGEKFGVWPGTHEHVYAGGWLERFLNALEGNSSWLETATFAQFVDREPPRGRVYLPAASYPEMMEWALPTPSRRTYESLQRRLKEQGVFDEWGSFLSGGTWKGFLAKYDESNRMARKMMRVSAKVAAASLALERACDDPTRAASGSPEHEPMVDAAALDESRNELWRGQCNCAYWHGIFGGLYLPHLRSAIYRHLILSENLVDAARGKRWDSAQVTDHDLDGEDEVLLESHWANVYVAPARGGAIFEIDARMSATNLLATMSHYEEAYHGLLSKDSDGSGDGAVSIHEAVRSKEKGLARLARPDARPRRSAVDRFLRSLPRGDRAWEGDEPDCAGAFAGARYRFRLRREDGAVGVLMSADGLAPGAGNGVPVSIEKAVWLAPDEAVRVEHSISAAAPVDVVFASEWNLAFLTGHTDYVFLEDAAGRVRSVAEPLVLENRDAVRIVDRLASQVVVVAASPKATFRLSPLETASQSEGGFERVFQGVTLHVCWPLSLAGGSSEAVGVALSVEPIVE